MCLKECSFMVIVACTLGSRLRQAMGFCLGLYFWEFIMKQCGHGHDVHSFSCHTVITPRFPSFISHIYNGSFCEVSNCSIFLKFCYVFLAAMIFIALNCKFVTWYSFKWNIFTQRYTVNGWDPQKMFYWNCIILVFITMRFHCSM